MLSSVQKELKPDKKDEQLFPLIQLIFNIAIQEVTRQVSVQCIERGHIIKKIFQAYINLIEMINNDHKMKRKNLKIYYAEKLDKYIGAQEDQIKQCKEQVDEYKTNYERLKKELDNYLFRLNQSNVMNSKFKKKLYNTQKDLEASQKKVKLLEKEKLELQEKVQELADKCGEELSTIDEKDQQKIMEIIEKEFEEEKEQSLVDSEVDIDNIPDREIIKEDDKYTDMNDFERYLKLRYGEKSKSIDIQTDRVTRRHMKLGVTASKLGIMKDRETMIDPRMFQRGGPQIVRMTYIAEIEDQDQIFEEDQNEEDGMTDNEGDQTLALDTDLNQSQENIGDISFQQLKRPQSSRGPVNIEVEDLEKHQQFNKFQTIKGKSCSRRQSNDINNQMHHPNVSLSKIDTFVSKEEPFTRKTTLIDVIGDRIKQRINNLMMDENIKQLEVSHPELFNQLISDMKESSKDMLSMNDQVLKRSKQVKFQIQVNHKKDKMIEKYQKKADIMEMDNYMLKEQINTMLEQAEEQEQLVNGIVGMLDRYEMGEIIIHEIKNTLSVLGDKLQVPKNNKTLMQLLEEKTLWNESMRGDTKVNISNDDGTIERRNLELEDGTQDTPVSAINIENQQEQGVQKDSNDDNNVKSSFLSKRFGQKKDGSNKRGRILPKFALFNIGQKKSPQRKGAHPVYQLLKKVQQKDPKDLKDIMPRKMLLRVITQVYQERPPFTNNDLGANNNPQVSQTAFNQSNAMSTQTQINASQNLIEWVYDYFMQKYGLKQVAEKKFVQLLSTCVLQKDYLPRIRLFGRFVEVYHELSPQDYNKYLEITETFIQQVLNFKIEGDEEKVLLPYNRALDYFKLKFEMRFISSAFQIRLQKLERMKIIVPSDQQKMHLKGVREAIDYDRFLEFYIDNFNFLQEEKEKMIKDFFLASDVLFIDIFINDFQFDNDGLLDLNDFQLTMKIFHSKKSEESYKLFEENAELGVDEENPGGKYLTIDIFLQLCLEKDLFNPKLQLVFLNSKDYESDFKKLQEIQTDVINLMRKRVSQVELNSEEQYLELIQSLHNLINDPYSSRVGIIRYKIIDKVIKRACINKITDNYMPVNVKRMGVKTVSSADTLQHVISFMIGSDY